MINYYADFLANCNFIVAILISTYTCSIYISCIHDHSYTLTYYIYIQTVKSQIAGKHQTMRIQRQIILPISNSSPNKHCSKLVLQ